MPIDPKEGLGVLGYDPEAFDSTEDFRAKVESEWLKKDQAHLDTEISKRIMGATNGKLVTKAKQYAKNMGLELEIKTDVATDAWDTVMGAVTNQFSTLTEQIAEAKKIKGNSKEVEELQRQYAELKKKHEDTDGLAKTWATKYEALENTVKTEKAQAKVDIIYARAEDAVKFKDKISKFELDGFRSFMRKSFPIHFDDEGNEYVTDAAGNRIKDEKVAGRFKDLSALYKEFADKEGLSGGAPQAGAPVRRTLPGQQPPVQQPVVGARPTRAVMPRQ